jgi:hypothetical protein
MNEDLSEDEAEGKVVIRGVDFPSNSNKDREERAKPEPEKKKAEKIITGKAIRRKKPVGSKLRDIFNGADVRGTISYVAQEIAIPAAKDFALDAVQQALQRMLWGDSYRRSFSSSNRDRDRGRVRYDGYHSSSSSLSSHSSRDRDRDYRDRDHREMSHRGRADHDFDEVILDSRGEAEIVIDRLRRSIEEYDTVTVAEMYDLIDITASFVDHKYGWTDLTDARVRRINGGYLLDLPKAILLD